MSRPRKGWSLSICSPSNSFFSPATGLALLEIDAFVWPAIGCLEGVSVGGGGSVESATSAFLIKQQCGGDGDRLSNCKLQRMKS